MLLGLFVQVGEKHRSQRVISAVRESDGVVRADIEVIQAVLASFSVVSFLKK